MVGLARFGLVASVWLLAGCGPAERLQNISQIAVAIGGVIAILGSWAGYKFGKDVEKEKDRAAAVRENGLEQRRKASEERETQLLEEMKKQSAAHEAAQEEQRAANKRLEEKLEPFAELAKKRHPELDVDAALALLHTELAKQKARSDDLEAKVQPRSLKPEEQAAIVKASHDIGGLPTLTIHVSAADAEAQSYAREFQRAFVAAGAKIGGLNFQHGGPLVGVKGLIIAVPEQPVGTKAPPGAQRLGEVLKRAGLAYEVKGWDEVKGDEVRLIVGGKR